ncbi:hypothetical protein Btru_050608 [Bulinus truncatus]|nr:hypothetical protein Btru_050608 [Bulinus truncatus]
MDTTDDQFSVNASCYNSSHFHLLDALKRETILTNVPTFVYLSVLFLMGVVGNPLILVVYSRKKKNSATIVLIEVIALVDLMTNIIIIPVNFYVLWMGLTHTHAIFCKVYFFLNYVLAFTSVFLLLAVAVVRYRKVCAPFDIQISPKHVKIFSVCVAVTSLVISGPFSLVHGLQVTQTYQPGVCGLQCGIDPDLKDSPWPMVINVSSIGMVAVCCAVLSVIYLKIGQQARLHGMKFKHKQSCIKSALYDSNRTGPYTVITESSTMSQSDSVTDPIDSETFCHQELCQNTDRQKPAPSVRFMTAVSPLAKPAAKSDRKHVNGRTTRMLLTITVVYILTNMTTLLLMLVKAPAFEVSKTLGAAESAVFNFFICSFLVNSAVNPFIYSFWNQNFRQECRRVL